MTDPNHEAPEVLYASEQPAVSRRESVKLASSVLALGAALGVPATPLRTVPVPAVRPRLVGWTGGGIDLRWTRSLIS